MRAQHVIEMTARTPMPLRPLTRVRVLRILADTLAALVFMHGLGWVHRDLKPDNVLITRE
jgi:serine/threonine protein kinase